MDSASANDIFVNGKTASTYADDCGAHCPAAHHPKPDEHAALRPVSAVVPAGHRVRVAIAGHDASTFTRYGPAEETFTLGLGSESRLDLPVRYVQGHGGGSCVCACDHDPG